MALRGRPPIHDFDVDDINNLRSNFFNWTEIANIVGNTTNNLYRWRQRTGYIDPLEDCDDETLDRIVSEFQSDHPFRGRIILEGYLRSLNLKISEERRRASVLRVDPEGLQLRLQRRRTRVRYNVIIPHQLWHIDGHHKLIHWGFVTHGCIDGGSHICTFLRCSDNNLSRTVIVEFINACRNYQIPRMVRADGGGENILVAKCMFYHRPMEDENPFLSGTSKANCKIEAFWRYVMEWAISFYYNIFQFMEVNELFSVDDEMQLFVLHYMFLSLINEDLDMTVRMWNNHPMAGHGRKSPYQMATQRADTVEENPPLLDENYLQEDLMPWFYVEDDIDENNDDGMYNLPNTKVVEPLRCPLTAEELQTFKNLTTPLDSEDVKENYIGRFIAAKEILEGIISQRNI